MFGMLAYLDPVWLVFSHFQKLSKPVSLYSVRMVCAQNFTLDRRTSKQGAWIHRSGLDFVHHTKSQKWFGQIFGTPKIISLQWFGLILELLRSSWRLFAVCTLTGKLILNQICSLWATGTTRSSIRKSSPKHNSDTGIMPRKLEQCCSKKNTELETNYPLHFLNGQKSWLLNLVIENDSNSNF